MLPGCADFGLLRFFAFALIFAAILDEAEPSDFVISVSRASNARKSRNADVRHSKANANKSSAKEQRSVEDRDHSEVPSFEKRDGDHFDHRDFESGVSVVGENGTASRLLINKCCSRDFYFDVENFACTPLGRVASEGDLSEKIKAEGNYLFVEDFPDCGNRSVVSVRLMSRVSVGVAGIAVDAEGVHPKYCVDRSSEDPLRVVVLTCHDPVAFCRTRTCFRKCCPLGYSYGLSGRKCRRSDQPFKPKFYNLTSLTPVETAKPPQYGIYLGDACGARGKYLLERDSGEVSYLGVEGTLFVPAFGKRTFSGGEFCVEFVKTRNRSGIESFLCFSIGGSYFENSQLQFFLLSVGFIVSCTFLLLTFLVYLFSSKSQNLYGKTLMCYIACLFTAYLCLAVIELKSREIDKGACTKMGYLLLFSFLAAFSWLNVMSFDIWKTFRVDRTVDRSKTDKGKLQFAWYSLYAWSFPSTITAACAYMNQVRDSPYADFRPDIGEENCWFSKKRKGIYVFFISPISLIITLNVIFYVQTAWKIWKVKSNVKKMDRQKTKKFSANKEQFIINGKLFVVMGIAWSLEIISFFVPHPIWYVTDAANALHGVFIFAVFVLKKKMLQKLSQQMRAPLKTIKKLTSSDSHDLSRQKNFPDLNTEGRTGASNEYYRK